MRQNHGIVDKKGLILILLHESLDEINTDIRSELAIAKLLGNAVDTEIGTGMTTVVLFPVNGMTISPLQLPEARLIEAKMRRGIGFLPQLPFSGNTCFVTGIPEVVPKGFLSTVESPKESIVTDIGLSRHQFHPRRSADRIGKGVGETHSLLRHGINIGRLVVVAAIGSDSLISHVISHDHYDIGFRSKDAC